MGFSPDWLALREPADRAARDGALLAAAARAAGPAPVIVDIGCGTGSMLRAMGDLVGDGARWRLVDNDPILLAAAVAAADGQAEGHLLDLADLDALPLDGATLVTASALLDLVSHDWLARLVALLGERKVPLHAGLSYDGRMFWDPPHVSDAAITEAFNRHQRRDKGLGPALGPDAVDAAAGLFRAHGFVVRTASSPWQLDAADAALHSELLRGVADAAEEAGADDARGWLVDRLQAVSRTRCRIGHVDLLAQLRAPGPRGGRA